MSREHQYKLKKMKNTENKAIISFLAVITLLLCITIFNGKQTIVVDAPPLDLSQLSEPFDATRLAGVLNNLDTSSNNITHSTSTVNTTSTQVFSSITKIGQIINDTNSTLTCSMDATGTTAVNSTVAAGRGVLIYASSSPAQSNTAMFGECYPGTRNCYAHKGAVNCLATAAVTITKWSK